MWLCHDKLKLTRDKAYLYRYRQARCKMINHSQKPCAAHIQETPIKWFLSEVLEQETTYTFVTYPNCYRCWHAKRWATRKSWSQATKGCRLGFSVSISCPLHWCIWLGRICCSSRMLTRKCHFIGSTTAIPRTSWWVPLRYISMHPMLLLSTASRPLTEKSMVTHFFLGAFLFCTYSRLVAVYNVRSCGASSHHHKLALASNAQI